MAGSAEIIAIGDIHGCAVTLQSLLKKLKSMYGTKPTYVFLGDYTDRGPRSREVVQYLLKFQKSHTCIFLRGNHDQMLLDAYEKNDWSLWLHNGGGSTLRSYDSHPEDFTLPEAHYKFFKDTCYYWETDQYLFVHAGLDPGKTVKENLKNGDPEEFMWKRDHIKISHNEWEKTVVFGHTPMNEPIAENQMVGIDTGCVYNKNGYLHLTAVSLPEMKFIQQKNID